MLLTMMAGGVSGSMPSGNVVSLNHFDGTPGSEVLSDEKPGVTWSLISGNTFLDNSYSKFGGSSLYSNGGQATLSGVPAIGVSPFCIQGWMRKMGAQYAVEQPGIVRILNGASSYGVRMDENGYAPSQKYTLFRPGLPNVSSAKIAFPTNVWAHFAWTRIENGTSTLYINGIAVLSAMMAVDLEANDIQFCDSGAYRFYGWMDEFMVTVGDPVYRKNFTPPTAPFE